MGRISNAEKAEKAAALLGQQNPVSNQEPQKPIESNADQAQNEGISSGASDDKKEITEINSTPGEDKDEPTATQELLDKNPIFVKAGIVVGDPESVAGAKYKAYNESLITEETLTEELKTAGVIVGDDPKEVEEKLAAYQESQKPALITEEDLEKDPNLKLAGVSVGDNIQEAYKKIDDYNQKLESEKPILVTQKDLDNNENLVPAGVVIGDTLEESDKKLQAHQQKLKDDAAAAKTDNNGESPVYHGDHLTEDIINLEGLQTTYDWDEVTAPEHLKLKPGTTQE